MGKLMTRNAKRITLLALAGLSLTTPLPGETHTMTLRQAVERALRQNPDLVIARLEADKAAREVDVARDPFIPKVYVGSGLAATYGFPMTVDQQAPSVIDVTGIASIINRPQRHRLAAVREEAKSAALGAEEKRDAAALRTVELFLEARRAARVAESMRAQAEGLERVVEALRLRAEAGRALPVEVKRAELDVARARRRFEAAEADRAYAEARLASVLGFPPGDRVQAAAEDAALQAPLPLSEEEAAAAALEADVGLRRLAASLRAKGFTVKAEKSERLPRMSLVAKYGLFARFNNFEEFFRRFQRHNAQIGVSFQVPVFRGPAYKATISRAQLEIRKLETELAAARSRIDVEARRRFQEVKQAQSALELARMELDLAREELDIALAKMDEGRASIREVEAARFVENQKWIAFYDARHALELARYRLLSRTGRLLAALR